jgi:hypothetical protein
VQQVRQPKGWRPHPAVLRQADGTAGLTDYMQDTLLLESMLFWFRIKI